jgi:hypothetical protein
MMLDMFKIFDARAIKRNSHPTTKTMKQTNFAKRYGKALSTLNN